MFCSRNLTNKNTFIYAIRVSATHGHCFTLVIVAQKQIPGIYQSGRKYNVLLGMHVHGVTIEMYPILSTRLAYYTAAVYCSKLVVIHVSHYNRWRCKHYLTSATSIYRHHPWSGMNQIITKTT